LTGDFAGLEGCDSGENAVGPDVVPRAHRATAPMEDFMAKKKKAKKKKKKS
jgi:hypothetical protein